MSANQTLHGKNLNPKTQDITLKLQKSELYFKTQHFTVDRFCLLMQPHEETRYYLIGFADGALDFAASLIYILSASKHDSRCKAQIVSAATKLMSEAKTSEEVSIPKAETYAMFLCSIQL